MLVINVEKLLEVLYYFLLDLFLQDLLGTEAADGSESAASITIWRLPVEQLYSWSSDRETRSC